MDSTPLYGAASEKNRCTVDRSLIYVPYVGYIRGLNVVIVNKKKTGKIMHSQVFDTSVEAGA